MALFGVGGGIILHIFRLSKSEKREYFQIANLFIYYQLFSQSNALLGLSPVSVRVMELKQGILAHDMLEEHFNSELSAF